MEGYILNPDEEFVSNLRQRIKDNGKYCLYTDKNNKKNKCPKPCRNGECLCGMYIPSVDLRSDWA